jgi:protein-S-isoprenylcysteine O-methyltransferase Ste14
MMFPILVWMYVRLAITEERDSEQAFGQVWRDYAALTPRFFPHFGSGEAAHGGDPHPTAKR